MAESNFWDDALRREDDALIETPMGLAREPGCQLACVRIDSFHCILNNKSTLTLTVERIHPQPWQQPWKINYWTSCYSTQHLKQLQTLPFTGYTDRVNWQMGKTKIRGPLLSNLNTSNTRSWYGAKAELKGTNCSLFTDTHFTWVLYKLY